MSSTDPVPDVAPEPDPQTPAPTPSVSSPNSFFFYLLILMSFLLYHRLAWEAILLLLGERLQPQMLSTLFYVWLIPVAGILGSIVVPSLGTTSVWIIGSVAVGALPLTLAGGYVLLFGNRRDLSA
jgi:hypothetical protein